MKPTPPLVMLMQLTPIRKVVSTMAACHGVPLFFNKVDAEKWLLGFAYDIDVAPPPLLP